MFTRFYKVFTCFSTRFLQCFNLVFYKVLSIDFQRLHVVCLSLVVIIIGNTTIWPDPELQCFPPRARPGNTRFLQGFYKGFCKVFHNVFSQGFNVPALPGAHQRARAALGSPCGPRRVRGARRTGRGGVLLPNCSS